jgi:hypothetical protein
MNIGDRVKVVESVTVYHHPQHKQKSKDIKGLEGELIDIITEWKGRPVSANFPYLVKFDKKFKAHFQQHELNVIT